ncbi:hypothetical protein TNCV_1969841, partial [Trichonephila clavipes]
MRILTLVRAVAERIREDPFRKKTTLAKPMNVSKRTMCHIEKEDLGPR